MCGVVVYDWLCSGECFDGGSFVFGFDGFDDFFEGGMDYGVGVDVV